jgi:hypothetical protein
MKRLSDILKEAMTPGFEKAFASTPKGVEVHMKHKETGKIVKTKFLGTHSAVAAAKKHINDMQGKGYTVHAKKLIEEVEQLGELKTSTLISYHTKSQKSAAELGNKASKEMDAGNMKKASALLKKVSKRQKSQSQAMGKIQKRYANLKDEVEHTDEELQESFLEILREMAKRGRPKKNPTAPAPSKMSKDDDEEENEEPDTGPEADKNITVQLKKAADQAVHGEKGGADIEFADGKKHFVHGHVAHKVLNAMEKMKPAQRAEAQKGIHQSHAHLMAVHKMLNR